MILVTLTGWMISVSVESETKNSWTLRDREGNPPFKVSKRDREKRVFPSTEAAEAWVVQMTAAPRTNARWTELEDIRLTGMAGVIPAHRIAEEMGRSVPSVRKRIERLGLDGRLYGEAHQNAKLTNLQKAMGLTLLDAGFTSTEIVKATGWPVTRSTMDSAARRRNREVSNADS